MNSSFQMSMPGSLKNIKLKLQQDFPTGINSPSGEGWVNCPVLEASPKGGSAERGFNNFSMVMLLMVKPILA